jgi:hypothetical protein
MMPMFPEMVPLAAEIQTFSAAPVAGSVFLALLVGTAWFTVFGFLASWMLDRSNGGRVA